MTMDDISLYCDAAYAAATWTYGSKWAYRERVAFILYVRVIKGTSSAIATCSLPNYIISTTT
jgi:hypothetical protein